MKETEFTKLLYDKCPECGVRLVTPTTIGKMDCGTCFIRDKTNSRFHGTIMVGKAKYSTVIKNMTTD